MKNIKKILIVLVAALVVFPFITKVNAAEPGEKVKVYVFEAGGCPYCEKELEYLKGLSSYNQKFEIVRKELYIDHIQWEEGADYQLGVKVATAFLERGFTDASYQGTPFVVISDLYAAASYSTDLEKYIDEAYENGDADIVGCFASGGDAAACFPAKVGYAGITLMVVLFVAIAGTILILYFSRRDLDENELEVASKKNEKIEDEKVEVKPVKKEVKVEKKTSKKSSSNKSKSKKK